MAKTRMIEVEDKFSQGHSESVQARTSKSKDEKLWKVEVASLRAGGAVFYVKVLTKDDGTKAFVFWSARFETYNLSIAKMTAAYRVAFGQWIAKGNFESETHKQVFKLIRAMLSK